MIDLDSRILVVIIRRSHDIQSFLTLTFLTLFLWRCLSIIDTFTALRFIIQFIRLQHLPWCCSLRPYYYLASTCSSWSLIFQLIRIFTICRLPTCKYSRLLLISSLKIRIILNNDIGRPTSCSMNWVVKWLLVKLRVHHGCLNWLLSHIWLLLSHIWLLRRVVRLMILRQVLRLIILNLLIHILGWSNERSRRHNVLQADINLLWSRCQMLMLRLRKFEVYILLNALDNSLLKRLEKRQCLR